LLPQFLKHWLLWPFTKHPRGSGVLLVAKTEKNNDICCVLDPFATDAKDLSKYEVPVYKEEMQQRQTEDWEDWKTNL
jgi:hypothetical protein